MSTKKHSGIINWVIQNPVTINIVLVLIVIAGFYSMGTITKELWPSISIDNLHVDVTLKHHSTPELVDKNITQVIYPLISNIEGIKTITSYSTGDYASFSLELENKTNIQTVLREVKNNTDHIGNLPDTVDTINVYEVKSSETPIHVVISSQVYPIEKLVNTGLRIQKEIQSKGIANTVYLYPYPYPEITIYAPDNLLKAKNLSLTEVANQIKSQTTELTLGKLSVKEHSLILKGVARKTNKESYGKIPIKLSDGSHLLLEDIIGKENIQEHTFQEDPPTVLLNGKRAVILGISKSKNEDTLTLCRNIKEYVANLTPEKEIYISPIWDNSSYLQERLDLITNNGLIGLILVLIILSLFLEWRIAFWSAAGIAFALIGSFYVMDITNTSINMISLFGFLITLGIIVDDAIVVGENFFYHCKKGHPAKKAASIALQEVKWPVIAMVSTTVIAFIPLFFITGTMGKFISVLPVAIISALVLSLFEALLILPVHLAYHCGEESSFLMRIIYFIFKPLIKVLNYLQGYINRGLEFFIKEYLTPVIKWCTKNRYSLLFIFLGFSILVITLIPAGVVKLSFFPEVEEDSVYAPFEFKQGLSRKQSAENLEPLYKALEDTDAEYIEKYGATPLKDYLVIIGNGNSHKGSLYLSFYSSKEGRSIKVKEYMSKLRRNIPFIPELITFDLVGKSGGNHGKPISINLNSSNDLELSLATQKVLSHLNNKRGVIEVATNMDQGVDNISIRQDLSKGYSPFTEQELFNSIKEKYQGINIDTFYRNEQKVNVYLRTPKEERNNLSSFTNHSMTHDLTLGQLAKVDRSQEAEKISRTQGERNLTVSAQIDSGIKESSAEIRKQIEREVLSTLKVEFPHVEWSWSGEAKSGNETVNSILATLIPTFLAIYLVLATVFKSYWQPLLIMISIPFGVLGAILGHWFMGIPMNLMSSFGLLALIGITVNDSLMLIDAINTFLKEGKSLSEALCLATTRRFRPIFLTTLTTILGMLSILFETSLQAQFLIPMVTSLVFGIGISTFLILFLIPSCYAIFIDFIHFIKLMTKERLWVK